MSFSDISMHLSHLYGVVDIVQANKAEGIPCALQGSTRNLQSHNWIPPPRILLVCSRRYCPSLWVQYNSSISSVTGIFLFTTAPLQNLPQWKVCLFWDQDKLFLSQGYLIQTSTFPIRHFQTILRPRQVPARAEPSNCILQDKHITLMPLTRPCIIERKSSILSLALTGRAPRHHRFMALIFVYVTFKDKAWCYRGLVYISDSLEAKM